MKLDFPLNNDDKISILEALFLHGEITLSNGNAIIYNRKINSTCRGFVSRKTVGGTIGDLRINCFDGYASITSQNTSDTSTVNYLILLIY